jgi:glycogen debranching enzyme
MTSPKRARSHQHDEDDRYQILATASLTLSGARVLKHGDTFAVFDRYGDIRPSTLLGSEGLYHEGARYLSVLRMRIETERLLLLSSTVREDNVLLAVDLMNPDLGRNGETLAAHGTLHVLRSKFLHAATCYEHIQVSNYGATALDVVLELEIGADFVDVFEVRGTKRDHRGTLHPAEHHADGCMLLGYTGLDHKDRFTRLQFAPDPDEREPDGVRFHLHLESKQVKDLYVTAACETRQDAPRSRVAFESAYGEASESMRASDARECNITTSNEEFNAWVRRSSADLRMLISQTPSGPYPYAGVPWYSTPFGRDGILTALQALWINPDLARGVLSFLAHFQASSVDDEADAEPGKILHEMRSGEMARLREIPFGQYYGSVDSTPLFVMLAAAYYEATGDLQFAAQLWPHVERALAWLDGPGDADGDGFIEYGRHSSNGLVQQGWKDSQDSVFHADGTAAEGPIALCEVQGYAYAARSSAARLAAALGRASRASELTERAEAMRARFDAVFWCDDLSTYALALDGHKRPCRVRSSNAGHCLFSGITLPQRAPILADQLLAPEMFSGWGIRTLAAGERRYNPMSYHNGSVWPHDNALIAAGFARYGLRKHALRVLAGMFDASLLLELSRLPELFCGFPRRTGEGPTLYPVACSPQAWAAAAPFMLLQAVLGLHVSGAEARVRFDHPVLPVFLDDVELTQLRVGASSLDLHLRRYPDNVGINVTRRSGPVEVLAVK